MSQGGYPAAAAPVAPLSPSTSIDLGHLEEAASELRFQDFSDVAVSPTTSRAPRLPVVPDADSEDGDEDEDPILGGGGGGGGGGKGGKQSGAGSSIFDLDFFAKYFDVTTQDVKERILWSVLPSPSGENYVDRLIRSNPDLYGPVWVNVTLVFSIAICGNIASYLSSGDHDSWHYDLTRRSASQPAPSRPTSPACLSRFGPSSGSVDAQPCTPSSR